MQNLASIQEWRFPVHLPYWHPWESGCLVKLSKLDLEQTVHLQKGKSRDHSKTTLLCDIMVFLLQWCLYALLENTTLFQYWNRRPTEHRGYRDSEFQEISKMFRIHPVRLYMVEGMLIELNKNLIYRALTPLAFMDGTLISRNDDCDRALLLLVALVRER